MKLINTLILSQLLLVYVSGKKTGGGGFGGSRPRPVPRPAPRPAPRPSKDDFASGFKPTSTTVSNKNPNPAYKPVNQNNYAPTLPNGGGGYAYAAARPGYGGGSLFFAGATGFLLGSFIYGGYNSRPSCRQYSSSGYDNGCYGRSTTGHQCKAQIPLCPIPDSIRNEWYTGSTVGLNLLANNVTCPVLVDFGETTAVERSDSNVTVANLTLAECMEKVVLDGTCSSKRFTYDEMNNKCGCCTTGTSLVDWDYTSAVYSFETDSPLQQFGAPTHCISGATLYWPRKTSDTAAVTGAGGTVSGGGNFIDQSYDCRCGSCNTCGAPEVSYMDWAGPFTVPPAVGDLDAVNSKPIYDPVDTCVCTEPSQNCNFVPSAASWVSASVWAVSSSILLLFALA